MVTFLLMLSLSTAVQAQSSIAKIKYEQAEEAFEKNDFASSLQRLNEQEN